MRIKGKPYPIPEPKRLKILVFGAGAVGMAFGGFLSRHHEVTLLGRARHMEAIRKKGLRVGGIWGRHRFGKMRALSDAGRLVRGKTHFDLVLICVKSYDTEPAARWVKKIAGPKTIVISLQNGLGNIEKLHRYLDPARVLAGRVIFGVEIFDAGAIQVTVMAHPTAIGETSRPGVTSRVRKIARLFSASGVPAVAAGDIRIFLWAKVIYNCALNPLASLLGSCYGQLAERELTRLMMDEIIREIYRVARCLKVRLHPPSAALYRKLFYAKLVPSTYHHHPSMLQDIRNKKRTEIESLNGEISRAGRRCGVPTPVNDFLANAIRRLSAKF